MAKLSWRELEPLAQPHSHPEFSTTLPTLTLAHTHQFLLILVLFNVFIFALCIFPSRPNVSILFSF